MNCFFCNQVIFNDDAYCYNKICYDHNVLHRYHKDRDEKHLWKVVFSTIIKEQRFYIDYILHHSKHDVPICEISVIKEINGLSCFKTVLTLPYPPITLTPSNIKEKLPIYLLLS